MDYTDVTDADSTDGQPRRTRVAAAVLVSIVILMAVDVAGDLNAGAAASHVLVEAFVMVLAVGGIAALWLGFQRAQVRAAGLDRELQAARAEASRYKEEAREAMRGLGEAIDSQFERWGLTAAERQVGLLLLKGLSHRDAARVRATSEATARQQALTIYRKSGLRNRSELSAFFLEDLLLPRLPD